MNKTLLPNETKTIKLAACDFACNKLLVRLIKTSVFPKIVGVLTSVPVIFGNYAFNIQTFYFTFQW